MIKKKNSSSHLSFRCQSVFFFSIQVIFSFCLRIHFFLTQLTFFLFHNSIGIAFKIPQRLASPTMQSMLPTWMLAREFVSIEGVARKIQLQFFHLERKSFYFFLAFNWKWFFFELNFRFLLNRCITTERRMEAWRHRYSRWTSVGHFHTVGQNVSICA